MIGRRTFPAPPRGLWIAMVLVNLFPAPAQAQSATGTIAGVVVDQTGGLLPGATITLRHPATGAEVTAVTDALGAFRAPLLRVGTYTLGASLPGFQTTDLADLPLTVGQTMTLRVELTVATVTAAVRVVEKPLLERSRSQVSSTVDETPIATLPVNGRNFIDFVLLTPGVARGNGGELSFAGQRSTLNSLIVDGADNNNTFFGETLGRTGSGRAPYQFSQEAVKEFQVNASAISAEYGRAGAGVINVVTRSGTNTVHGSAFEFFRHEALNATNAINRLNNLPKSPYRYHQFGGTLGGPLRKNRDFFFANYDGQRNREPNLVVLNVPPGTPTDADTTAAIETLRPLATTWNRTRDQDGWLIKTDHHLRADQRLSLRYNHQDFTGEGFEAPGSVSTFQHTGASLVRTRTLNGSWTTVIGSKWFNELRAQYARDHEPGFANSDAPEAVIRQSGSPVLVIGRNRFSPRENRIDRFQMADTAMWAFGAHQVKAGADIQLDWISNYFPGLFAGSYQFNSLASFNRGRPDVYMQAFPGPGTDGAYTHPNTREYAVFVHDEWKARADLTLQAGLRYDLQDADPPRVRNPDRDLAAAGIDTSYFRPDRDNLAPRLGLAWSPSARPFVLRAGWGWFFGRIPAIALTAAQGTNGVNIVSLRFDGDQVPTYPQRFETLTEAIGVALQPSIFYIDRHFENPRVTQANAAIEWQLDDDVTLTVGYLFADGAALTRTVDRNIGSRSERVFTIAGTDERVTYPFVGSDRPFPNFRRVLAYESSAASRYHGVTADLHRRFAAGLHFRLAYTLSRVEDTVPDATAVAVADAPLVSNPADYEADRALGDNDRRHRVVASGVYDTTSVAESLRGVARVVASGWSVSAILTAQSGPVYSARVDTDINGDRNAANDLAPGTRRNAFGLPAIATLDARLTRTIPIAKRAGLQLIFEGFNLFNRDNIVVVQTGYYTVTGAVLRRTDTFEQPALSAGERILQLAVRLKF